MINNKQNGFTIIELLIATVVFSIVLLIAAATLVQLGKLYYKGIITAKTQSVARSTMDSVTRSIQFSNGGMISLDASQFDSQGVPIQARCFGTTRFTYVIGAQVDGSVADGSFNDGKIRNALWQDTVASGSCNQEVPLIQFSDPYATYGEASAVNHNGRALLDNSMRLQSFNIQSLSGQDLYLVNVKVLFYADPSLLDDVANPTACKSSFLGGQWCAISDLTSVVYSRSR